MSYDPLPSYQHARGSGRRRDAGNGALERLEKYIYEELWSCCQCQHSMTMTKITMPACLECGHHRCPDCSMDWVKRRKTKEDSIDSGSIYSISAGRGNGGARNFASHDSDFGDSAMGNSALLNRSAEPDSCASPASIDSGIGSVPCSLDDKPRLKNEPRGLIHDICARRSEPSASQRTQTAPKLIKLATAYDEEAPLFPLDPVIDSTLVKHWRGSVLHMIESRSSLYEGMNSIHFFRQGEEMMSSHPAILVSVDAGANQVLLHERISSLFDNPLIKDCTISFEQSAVRRTLENGLLPICKPRNTSFQSRPGPGASIGIENRLDCTGTLGGFVEVDDRVLILTVDHIVPDSIFTGTTICITHPSQQESEHSAEWTRVENLLTALKDCCGFCQDLLVEHSNPSDFYKVVNLIRPASACYTAKLISMAKNDLNRNRPCRVLGSLVCKSGMRSKPTISTENGSFLVEMDWALFTIDSWSEAHGLELHAKMISTNIGFRKVVPRAPVKAFGRTSGHQTGAVNTVMSIIRHGGRFTREWSICKDAQSTQKEWIEGGIGVDGDSGSWIFGSDGGMFGMVWGRDRPQTNPITLFTPIEEIKADIVQRLGAKVIRLPGHKGGPSAPILKRQKDAPAVLSSPLRSLRLSIDERSTVQELEVPSPTCSGAR